jgi:hypothetical protein
LTLALCRAQTGELATFGTTVVIPGGLTGKIYFMRPTLALPNFAKLEPVGTIYAKGVFIPPREFTEGFPGLTDRVEWFAIDFTGRFYVEKPGNYRFQLGSDDGSKLYIDHKTILNNDGVHGTQWAQTVVKLTGGVHAIRLSYFQGPRYHLSLMLSVAGPGDAAFRPFNTDDFKPPADLAGWKYGSPGDFKEVPDADAGRRKLKDAIAAGAAQTVPVSIRVLSGGEPVHDLTRADFLLYDNGERVQIVDFGFARRSLDLMLLLDASGNMDGFHSAAAIAALKELDAGDRVGVIVFAQKQVLLLGLASDRKMAAAALRRVAPLGGGAELNAAVGLTARYLRDTARPDAARAIVMVTANHGAKEISERAARDALWQGNVTLSGLLAGPDADAPGAEDGDVRRLVAATGGSLLRLEAGNFPWRQILRALRDRYAIGYPAPEGPAGTIRELRIELTPRARDRYRDARIQAPAGYVLRK